MKNDISQTHQNKRKTTSAKPTVGGDREEGMPNVFWGFFDFFDFHKQKNGKRHQPNKNKILKNDISQTFPPFYAHLVSP